MKKLQPQEMRFEDIKWAVIGEILSSLQLLDCGVEAPPLSKNGEKNLKQLLWIFQL